MVMFKIHPNGRTFDVKVKREGFEEETLRPKYRTVTAARNAIALYKSGTYISLR